MNKKIMKEQLCLLKLPKRFRLTQIYKIIEELLNGMYFENDFLNYLLRNKCRNKIDTGLINKTSLR